MQNRIYLQPIVKNTGSFLKRKAIVFLKEGLLISFIFATLLYILMRIFFIGTEFSTQESVELYFKTFLVTWSYINAWKLICLGIIWIETKTNKVKLAKVVSLPVLKKTAIAILVLVAGFAYTVKAGPSNRIQPTPVHQSCDSKERVMEVDPKFYFWTK